MWRYVKVDICQGGYMSRWIYEKVEIWLCGDMTR